VGKPAPDFKVVTTSGQTVTLQSFKNRVLVIDFFASWCIPCRTSVPHLVAMNNKFGKQGLQILGMSADDSERVLWAFADGHRINYPLAMAGESTQKDFGIRSVPVMFIIDRNGRIDEVYIGFSNEIARAMENRIKKLLTAQ
jgi:peroxiredoxin